MATKPRSYFQILSDMIDTFVSRTEIERLKVGNPILTILEAAAQSDTRATQDYFALLNAISLDSASGTDLDNIASREGTARLPAKTSTGFVTFSDTTINKISNIVYQGATAPVPNTTALKVENASNFPNSGQVYIGRGTANYEGPLTYTAKTNNGSYWTLTLSGTGTSNFHNIGESVILAQKGTRIIPANTIIQVPQGATDSILFSTVNEVFIEDGETSVGNVEIIANNAGKLDVPSFSIREVVSQVFSGIAVTNPLALTNGRDVESDSDLRERLRKLRQSRVNGTSSAVETALLGATAEGKTIVSSKVYEDSGKSNIYIDDGSGYEESYDGVAYEILTNSAAGGEQIFQLSQRPVALAYLESALSAPFAMVDGSTLSVNVGGINSTHTFTSDSFLDISSATAYEIVASINGDESLNFSAKTTNGGTKVIIFSKNEDQDEIQIIESDSTANNYLNFSVIKNYTLRLYKNDELLYKNGLDATISSKAYSTWDGTIISGDTLEIIVDGTSAQSVSFVDQDFIDAGTGYSSVSASNSLQAWASVFNKKIAGITAVASDDSLSISSNKGRSSSASVSIVGGTLLSRGVFDGTESAVGQENDYTLNRNLSQIKLAKPLNSGDRLTVSTENTRAYLESAVISGGSITFGSTAKLYIVVDGEASIVPTGINASITANITAAAPIATYTFTSVPTTLLENLRVGDYFFSQEPGEDQGFWKISNLTTSPVSFSVERSTITTGTTAFTNYCFIRSSANIQTVSISAGTYSLSALAALIESSLEGVNCYVYKNTKLRIASNGYENSDIMLVDVNSTASALGFTKQILYKNNVAQAGYSESNSKTITTPQFIGYQYSTVGGSSFTYSGPAIGPLDTIRYDKRNSTPSINRWGAQQGTLEQLSDITTSGTAFWRADSFLNEKLVGDTFGLVSPLAVTPRDSLSVILDKNSENKTFNINMYRELAPAAAQVYGTSNIEMLDVANGSVSLYNSFGSTTSFFDDFAVYMRARGKSHSTTANTTILFRNSRYGPEGEGVRVAFANPQSENAPLSFSTDRRKDFSVYNIHLPSGALISPTTLTGNHKFVSTANRTYTALSGNVSRSGSNVTVTLNGVNTVMSHSIEVGDIIYQVTDQATGNVFRAGAKTVTAVTQNTFSYTEAGAAGSSSVAISYSQENFTAGTSFTISALTWTTTSQTVMTATIGAHPFKVGDVIFFGPSHYHIPTGEKISSGYYKITSITGTTVSWDVPTMVGSGTATLIGTVTYSISEGSTVRVKVTEAFFPVEIGSMVRASNIVTVGMVMDASRQLASAHNFSPGDTFYLDTTDPAFPSGTKVITEVTSSTIKYYEVGANATSTFIARVAYNTNQSILTPVTAGNIVKIDKSSGIYGKSQDKVARIAAVSGSSFSFYEDADYYTSSNVYLPVAVGDTAYLKFFSITAQTSSVLVSWVNSNISSYVTAVTVPANGAGSTTGTGTVSTATQEEFFLKTSNGTFDGTVARSLEAFPLFDGANAVRSCQIDNANSKIRFKAAVTTELTSNADFNNERFRISPVTTKQVSKWLNSSAVSSLFNNAGVFVTSGQKGVTISTDSLGSGGAVEVSGGNANSAIAIASSGATHIHRKANNISQTYKEALGWSMNVSTEQLSGFVGGQWVKVSNNNKTFKSLSQLNDIGLGTSITSISDSLSLLTATNLPFEYYSYQDLNTRTLQFETYGGFTKIKDISVSPFVLPRTVMPGSFIYITLSGASFSNIGMKKVVAVDSESQCFWIEGSGATETVTGVAGSSLNWLGYNSWCPGDSIVIENDLLGPSNNGTFLISDYSLDIAGAITGIKIFGLVPFADDATLADAKIIEKDLLSMYGKIIGISSVDSATSRVLLGFNKQRGLYSFDSLQNGSASERLEIGAIITGLDKLSFGTNIQEGLDGYRYNTGLIAEANKILYGDESNSFVYPGVLAVGTNVGISGSLIKRVKISLGIKTGSSNITDIVARAKNAVATVINSSLAGTNIAISDIIEAVNRVAGITSVVPLYPIYNDVNDFIKIQGSEKARILDINNDITITILG